MSKRCPICETDKEDNSKLCVCGYNFEEREITDSDKIIAYLANIKSNWPKYVNVIWNVDKVQTEEHGKKIKRSPNAKGWSQTKTADLLGKSKSTISDYIKSAEGLKEHPELKNEKNQNKARKRLKEIENGSNIESISFEDEPALQEHLFKNWEHLDLSNEWKIIKSSLKNGKFKTEVGEMDILVKHRSEPRWLVIELKVDKSSDVAVGQILRYMGWIKLNKAEVDEKVEGLIISNFADKQILYALFCTSDIRLFEYHFDGDKLDFEEIEIIDKIIKNLDKLTKEEQYDLIKKLENLRSNHE